MSKHILVLSQYFYPENFRVNDICFEWIKRGYKVTVITGIPNYPKGKFFKGYGFFKKRRENINGVNVIRIPLIPRGNNSFMLALNYLSFAISGWFWKVFTRIKADIVFNFEVSPMTQALPGVWFARKRKIPFYIYVQDLWPENLETVGGVKNRMILKSVNKMVDYVYKNSTKILVTSKSFKDNIIARGYAPDKVIYWPQYAEDLYKPIQVERNKNNILNVMFTGNIGDAQGLDILPKLAVKLKKDGHEKRVLFTLVGDGRNRKNLEDIIVKKEVKNMFVFAGQKDPQEIPLYLSKADVAFLSFKDNELFRMTIPAKLQTYLACGKPVFAIASGETKKIIEDSKSGLCSDPGDIDDSYDKLIEILNMTDIVLSTMSHNALEYSIKNFNKKGLMDELDQIIS